MQENQENKEIITEPIKQKKHTIWSVNFVLLCCIAFFQSLGQHGLGPLLTSVAMELGATTEMAGFITGLVSGIALALRPISGPAIDTFNKKRLINFSMAMSTIAMTGYALSTSVAMLIAARCIQGISLGFGVSLMLTLVSDSLPDDLVVSGIGVFSVAQSLATAIGPAVSEFLTQRLPYRTVFLAGACLIGTAFVLTFFIKAPEMPKEKKKFKITLKGMLAVEALSPALIMLFLSMAYSTYGSFIKPYGKELGISGVGVYFTVYAIALLAAKPFSVFLSQKFSIKVAFLFSMCCFIASLVIVAFSRSLLPLLIAAAIGAFGYGGCQPVMQGLVIKSVPKTRRGAASGTNYLCVDIGHFVGPWIAGKLISLVGYSNMYLCALVPLFCGIIVFFVYPPKSYEDLAQNVSETK